MRTSIATATLAAAAWALAGCEVPAAGPATFAAPSFDAQCARLPPSRFEVVATPIRVAVDRTRSQRELTGMYEQATARHLTMGLTQARIGHQSAIEVSGLQDAAGERVCMRVAVRVELSMQPLTVFVARELDDDPCRQSAVRDHEWKHVAVYERALAESTPALAASLEAAFGGRTFGGRSAPAVQADVQDAVGRHLDAFLDATGRAIRARQAEVDTPEEYARVGAACKALRPP